MSRRRASSRWPVPSATSVATPPSRAGFTPSRDGSASRSGAEASSLRREKTRSMRRKPTSASTWRIRGRIPSRPRPIRNLRRRSRTPSTHWTPLTGRCWCCATSKDCRRRKWPRSWASASMPSRAGCTGRGSRSVQTLAPVLGRPVVSPPRGALCPDVLTLFSQHLEGEIDPGTCATMEAHLAQCHHCRDACESLKRTLAICRQLPTPDVPASLAASVQAAIQAFLAPPAR